MSSILKNKMYEYEVMPPATAWDQIVICLDEQSLQKNISQKLYNQEVITPATTWSKIANTLDLELQETAFRSEVLNLQVQPPLLTWSKIAEQLDKQPQENFSNRVYEYEVAPPAGVWNNIDAALDAEQTIAPVIPIRKTYSRLFRIAAAAVIVGILAWAGFNLLNNGEKTTDEKLADKNIKTTLPTVTPSIEVKQTPIAEEIKEEIPVISGTDNQIALAKTESNSFKKPIKFSFKDQATTINVHSFVATENHTGSDDITIVDEKSLHNKKKATTAVADNATETRYLVYLTEQGDIVKLSKKLADLKCIYTKDGKVSQDALAKLDAAQCTDQVKFWQEKMANSSLQSSSNPLELIEILK